MFTPIISVVVPAYNIENYLEATLNSLCRQSFRDFEVLIVNDGSTDKTPEIARQFCDRDERFKLLSKPNGGLSSARNHGIVNARGKYIALLDGDDVYCPDKLANHYQWLESDSEIGLVYSASQAMRDDGTLTWVRLSGKPISSDPLAALLCKNFVCHGSNAVFRRSIFAEVGEFDESLSSCEDVDYWLRIAATRKWRFQLEPSVQCYYRVRPSGLSFDIEVMKQTQMRVIESACDRNSELTASLRPTAYAYMNRYLARLALTAGDIKSARDYLDLAWDWDKGIFFRDPRSLVTLISVKLAPIAKSAIRKTLGSATTS